MSHERPAESIDPLLIPLVGVAIDTSQFEGAGPDRRLPAGIAVADIPGIQRE